MGGQKFQYDESGSTFLYFLISFLGLILVPSTFYFWPADETPEVSRKSDVCRCDGCMKKELRLRKPAKWKGIKKTLQRTLLLIGWAVVGFLVYKVQEFDYEYANFDPYDILGVGIQASQNDIKKAYRKLSLIYHPDKPTGDEKKFMKLNKAYQALTDDVARRNYELYGNPDGPGAMHFGIALPSWIIEKENSLWVLGLYGLVFMIGLPTAVAIWWYRSSKFSNDQVLLDTTQLYYYLFHKTPEMVFRRCLMVLAASLEFEKGHNPEIQERPTDNFELVSMMKILPNLGEKNKERPLCYPYSMKARILLHAHLSRIPLNEETLDKDRLYIVKYCPTLINEMVTCVAQLIMLAHAGRVKHLPTLETVENTMKLSPCIVQALWESKRPLCQLPHVKEEAIKNFVYRKQPVKSLKDLAVLKNKDRRKMLNFLSDEQYSDVLHVIRQHPHVHMTISYEVIDDDDTGMFTAGAIVTVTVLLKRVSLEKLMPVDGEADEGEEEETTPNELESPKKQKEKYTGWVDKKKKYGRQSKTQSKSSSNKVKKPDKTKAKEEETSKEAKGKAAENDKKISAKAVGAKVEEVGDESDYDDSGSHSDESRAEEADNESHREEKKGEDEDAEWERFQRGLTKKEKVLEGKSKFSHSVHAPFFPENKQEYWWAYVCDRKRHWLITAPYQITNLIDEEEVQLKFTAPHKPGVYVFQVCLRSDSYLGVDVQQDIKLDVKEAKEIPIAHPQWEDFSSEEEGNDEDLEGRDYGNGAESEFTTDDSD